MSLSITNSFKRHQEMEHTMKIRKTAIISVIVGILFVFAGAGYAQDGKTSVDEWTKILESKRTRPTPPPQTAPAIPVDLPSDTVPAYNAPAAVSEAPMPGNAQGIAVTLYWHMADDADVYLNGMPLRNYEPSFRTRGDEAPQPAFQAQTVINNGDVFTVGGRRGGSYGFMLIAADASGRIVFKTEPANWRVYMPGDRPDWYQPSVAASSPSTPVSVQPDPWYPQKELNNKFGNAASSVWGQPSERFSFLTAVVTLSTEP